MPIKSNLSKLKPLKNNTAKHYQLNIKTKNYKAETFQRQMQVNRKPHPKPTSKQRTLKYSPEKGKRQYLLSYRTKNVENQTKNCVKLRRKKKNY